MKISARKQQDLHKLARAIAPNGELDCVYPAADDDELKEEYKAAAEFKRAKRSTACGKKREKELDSKQLKENGTCEGLFSNLLTNNGRKITMPVVIVFLAHTQSEAMFIDIDEKNNIKLSL